MAAPTDPYALLHYNMVHGTVQYILATRHSISRLFYQLIRPSSEGMI
jgi:hypothetical protein